MMELQEIYEPNADAGLCPAGNDPGPCEPKPSSASGLGWPWAWLAPLALALALALAQGARAGEAYDPLTPGAVPEPAFLDWTVHDAARSRDIPVRVYLPASPAPAAVVLFSPGLGGSREGYAYLGRHWAGRGYVGVFLQHPGSDDEVWRDEAPAERMPKLRQAASLQNFLLRAQDVHAVLDQLERWNAEAGHPLSGRLDLGRGVGMAGHSFGAITTQAVSGQSYRLGGSGLGEPRVRAALPMSPSRPRLGGSERAFGSVAIPWMLMTGTKDDSPIGNDDAASRLEVFPALPPGGKYELVLDGASHFAFSDRALVGGDRRNPNHHRAILALSTAFWDAWLRGDAAARAWLDGEAARGVLEAGDRWQKK